jgi:hypothetical protein
MSGADESLPSGVRVVASLARPNLPPKSLERLPLMVVKMIMVPCPEDFERFQERRGIADCPGRQTHFQR